MSPSDRFASLLGAGRGLAPAERLDARQPSAGALAACAALSAQVELGRYADALDALCDYGASLRSCPPLLDALCHKLCFYLARDSYRPLYARTLLAFSGAQAEHLRTIVMVSRPAPQTEPLAVLHLRAAGTEPSADAWEDAAELFFACGASAGRLDARVVEPGQWQKPGEGVAVCERCALRASEFPETRAEYHLFLGHPQPHISLLISAAGLLDKRLRRAFADGKRLDVTTARTLAEQSLERRLIAKVARLCADNPDAAARRALGRAVWEELLEELGVSTLCGQLSQERWRALLWAGRPSRWAHSVLAHPISGQPLDTVFPDGAAASYRAALARELADGPGLVALIGGGRGIPEQRTLLAARSSTQGRRALRTLTRALLAGDARPALAALALARDRDALERPLVSELAQALCEHVALSALGAKRQALHGFLDACGALRRTSPTVALALDADGRRRVHIKAREDPASPFVALCGASELSDLCELQRGELSGLVDVPGSRACQECASSARELVREELYESPARFGYTLGNAQAALLCLTALARERLFQALAGERLEPGALYAPALQDAERYALELACSALGAEQALRALLAAQLPSRSADGRTDAERLSSALAAHAGRPSARPASSS